MGRWARNGPFPFKNDLFLVYSTIAESRAKFDHFRPEMGRWAINGPFPFKTDFFLAYSTIAEIRGKFDHFGPQKGRWARNGPFQIRNSHHKLLGPDKIVVQDWKHPVLQGAI